MCEKPLFGLEKLLLYLGKLQPFTSNKARDLSQVWGLPMMFYTLISCPLPPAYPGHTLRFSAHGCNLPHLPASRETRFVWVQD